MPVIYILIGYIISYICDKVAHPIPLPAEYVSTTFAIGSTSSTKSWSRWDLRRIYAGVADLWTLAGGQHAGNILTTSLHTTHLTENLELAGSHYSNAYKFAVAWKVNLKPTRRNSFYDFASMLQGGVKGETIYQHNERQVREEQQ